MSCSYIEQVVRDYKEVSTALLEYKKNYFPSGTQVRVDCGQYKGLGVVASSDCRPELLAVRIPNDNVWWYPIEKCVVV